MSTSLKPPVCGSRWSSQYLKRASHVRAKWTCTPVIASLAGISSVASYTNPSDLVKREVGLQSTRLTDAVRTRVEGAIESLSFRVTVGDVAAKAGVKLSEADEALKALAYDSLAALEVSAEGDVVYEFPGDFRATIRSKSLLLQVKATLNRTISMFAYMTRVVFGASVIVFTGVVWCAIFVASLAKSDDSDSSSSSSSSNDNSSSSKASKSGTDSLGGPSSTSDSASSAGPSSGTSDSTQKTITRGMFATEDFLCWMDTDYDQNAHKRAQKPAKMTFMEHIYSFVFGDGDPNCGFEDIRWAAVGRVIQAKGGVVTAEELAPFLDPPAPNVASLLLSATSTSSASLPGWEQYQQQQLEAAPLYADESFVLPALIKFGGEPYVDEAGHLLYRFPSLQRTASDTSAGDADPEPPLHPLLVERPWVITAAPWTGPGSISVHFVVILGLVNLAGVAYLRSLLDDPASLTKLIENHMGFMQPLMPWLSLYAVAFFAIPACRWLINKWRNQTVDTRNGARALAAYALNQLAGRSSGLVSDKVRAARKEGEHRVLRRVHSVFATDGAVGEQREAAAGAAAK